MRPEKIHKSVAVEEEEEEAAAAAVVPSFFKCPISLELMRDPVVLCTRQSYKRSSIKPYMSSDDADVGFLGARAEPHVATSHPELVRSARWRRLVRRPCTTPLDSLYARGYGYRG